MRAEEEWGRMNQTEDWSFKKKKRVCVTERKCTGNELKGRTR